MGSFTAMMTEIREEAARQAKKRRRPVQCPQSGHRLETHPDGGKICPFDGWRP